MNVEGVPLQRLELGGCRVGAAGAQRLAEALKNPQGRESLKTEQRKTMENHKLKFNEIQYIDSVY